MKKGERFIYGLADIREIVFTFLSIAIILAGIVVTSVGKAISNVSSIIDHNVVMETSTEIVAYGQKVANAGMMFSTVGAVGLLYIIFVMYVDFKRLKK